jgi:hypothetical protein
MVEMGSELESEVSGGSSSSVEGAGNQGPQDQGLCGRIPWVCRVSSVGSASLDFLHRCAICIHKRLCRESPGLSLQSTNATVRSGWAQGVAYPAGDHARFFRC